MTAHREDLQEALQRHAAEWRVRRVDAAFAAHPERHARLSRQAAELTLDFSKNRLDEAVLDLLVALAESAGLRERIEAMFAGQSINTTEERAVLHTALRARDLGGLRVGDEEIASPIAAVKTRMRALVEALHRGDWRGFDGQPITDVVNLGIGGSDLGPRMACTALRDDAVAQVRLHFVSNVDGGDIAHVLRGLDPARTAFIIASKSFTTSETMRNARTAQAWLTRSCPHPGSQAAHFLGITARPDRAREFGIDESRILPLWDWVGGRFSLWSAIGLPIAMAVGMDKFEELLAGAEAMDRHFRTTPWPDNLPVLLALIGIWNSNFLGAETFAVVPYDERLAHLPAYLQQLEMESNGKRITHHNQAVTGHTAPILWGGLGTDVQHAFFQLLHQGTRLVPVDFILALHNPLSPPGHHDMLVANCLAQAQALMQGRTAESLQDATSTEAEARLSVHRATPGNQPSNLLLMEALTPRTLGALIALHEHKTFVQGVIWGINSFDQWGVELGKVLADVLLQDMQANEVAPHHDPSTAAALRRYLSRRASP